MKRLEGKLAKFKKKTKKRNCLEKKPKNYYLTKVNALSEEDKNKGVKM